MESKNEKILITGALGQIGTELTAKLVEIYGKDNVIASGIDKWREGITTAGHYERIDVTNFKLLEDFIKENKITTVYHLASLLSGTSEKQPLFAWKLNLEPLLHLCELAKEGYLKKIFWPSSIAVFGKGIPKHNVGQDVVLNPTTVYGISKMAGEKWCEYYHDKYGVDVRSIRYPGLISWKAPAGGGTTDYAVEIFYEAVEKDEYQCFISENTAMPMLYMDDAINATIKLMQEPAENISVWGSYNLGGMSFTPAELANEIKKVMPDFKISYQPDFRQSIADSWPASIDDSKAREDWGLSYEFDIKMMTEEMIKNLKVKLGKS
ncbi:NAD-dependent epimerase/dehydratase family protein [Riemerella anatipestifer]|uniref:NAD-dependent epimerase/dehydratase family protein n=1 Tax=Riemerella anatipestifer TaxID=34085 RepID=A0AAP6HD29_RIEAN|nr:NAD-dependent epimerase/dehydratase family protein [Riemerella anatipestifer]MBT0549740.1 NAD-dependent epimerase/dehydratase family protein [Riemerella anatipestifer]MBT0556374.1 NAD-dependent epimerase/dehydratase family protein [Riemerella anatipestifer]MBT0560503.1 NAD-dependent epimerase/dehydratase family protein [Riemerella anatipestifer]MCD5968289.1 NAD-dependent epimerase/dehydratase family protein [Riemerella anatipestifer]MCO7354170.1 NAD-dependent epimerase/dehydratase family pr